MRRRLARELALQSLYQMEMNGVDATDAITHVVEEAQTDDEGQLKQSKDVIEPEDVRALVQGTINNKDRIDQLLLDYLKGWQMDRLSRVDREVLRLAAYEMVYREDVPPKVVVNEAIELAKHFGTEESGKFVNGVLGKMIKEIEEIKAKSL
ncbi:transcription antitermination factor NusB [Paenibacillus xerothermodurans]|uniref:Transcription antitermination protein NusB n=1 Tax=Paenibacillus xerothermodurans TaxID=1977292 RepID=A0A2W1NEH8_PAEXE|nr:transcription antitermination factor NusB [Paenibacillus xerothermodurans]PZE22050.1 transcription antitermination factor NusB [Paenibacillus xerothermodurans]